MNINTTGTDAYGLHKNSFVEKNDEILTQSRE